MDEHPQKKTDGEIVAPADLAPELEWLNGEVPRSTSFDDTYFSRAGGLSETRHVFLAGNGLPERWAGRQTFTIAEFGFGTGLNFLATLAALKEVAVPPNLTFISFELHPMTRDQLARALSVFPELAGEVRDLIGQWSPQPGWASFSVQGVQLWLGIGDARDLIADIAERRGGRKGRFCPDCTGEIDAWYFDGFSPSKNPSLWEAELLSKAQSLTAEDGTFATYTSAGWVRRNLIAAGFALEKRKGFAGKREMVVGWNAGS